MIVQKCEMEPSSTSSIPPLKTKYCRLDYFSLPDTCFRCFLYLFSSSFFMRVEIDCELGIIAKVFSNLELLKSGGANCQRINLQALLSSNASILQDCSITSKFLFQCAHPSHVIQAVLFKFVLMKKTRRVFIVNICS